MTLKNNSKAYIFLLVSMLLSGIYSLVLTIIAIVNNLGIPYTFGTHIVNIINAISGRLPIIILCFMFLKAGSSVEKCLKALSVYFVLSIAFTVLVPITNLVAWGHRGDFRSLIRILVNVTLSFLAAIGIKEIIDNKKTRFFKIVWLITTVYNVYIFSSMGVLTSMILQSNSEYFMIWFNNILTLIFYIIFNIAVYIFVMDIDVSNEVPNDAEYGEMNIARCAIFTIITFGIYQWVWLYHIAKNIKHLDGDNSSVTGELLCLMFIPFYWIYWVYTRSKTIKKCADERQIVMTDNSVLFVVLSLFGFGVLQIALLQSDLNTLMRRI